MLLAIDSSTQVIGLALFDGSSIIAESIWHTRSHHTIELSPAIQQLLLRSDKKPRDLSGLGVALGPGSFTSLRIGLAVVKGMAMALHIPAIGVPTLDILAAAQPFSDLPMAAVLSAGRQRLAVGWYAVKGQRWVSEGLPTIMTAEELARQIHKPTYICGEMDVSTRQMLARKYRNVTLAPAPLCLRRPAYLAEITWERLQEKRTDNLATLSPIYLRTTDGE
ncbi:MAG: tRNA (adenosine(37)-N6)-threonylcarbamoyltransferase complex dimerization subunit type 1 TsaB [Anaerolineaceae bacterium]|nr:tRNA (adenosine(37)-N6)-threonylcarbamoyltransferase complex dimerization subunit type 1 TsaB [Anaerolineaceae bacterium]